MSSISYRVIEAAEGTLGVDINQRVTPAIAKALIEHGYTFVVRYVRRAQAHEYDLSFDETTDILASGLGLMIVQHVAPEGWMPTPELGFYYGKAAAGEMIKLRLPGNTMIWCDLEGVSDKAKIQDVVDYCNAWYNEIKKASYTPGLYVGYKPGLSSLTLYKALRFTRYWGAYNINADEIPTVRGICMKQRVAKEADRVPGLEQDGFDVDVVLKDQLGDLPLVLVGLPCETR